MVEQRVTWGEKGWAETDGWAKAHCINTQTGEYIGPQDVWVSKGTGLPAGAYMDEPMAAVEGKAIINYNGAWVLVDDHRGIIVYDKETGQQHSVTDIGPLSDSVTNQPPPSQFSVWNYSTEAWEIDVIAEQQAILQHAKAQQVELIAKANQYIAIIQPAVEGGYASQADTDVLPLWQRYRYELTQMKEQPGWPASVQWPIQPATLV